MGGSFGGGTLDSHDSVWDEYPPSFADIFWSLGAPSSFQMFENKTYSGGKHSHNVAEKATIGSLVLI